MNIRILATLLVLQIIIVGLVLAFQSRDVVEPDSFIELDVDAVNVLEISTPSESIALTLGESGWRMLDDIPVDKSKVNRILEKLANAKGGWPVATSKSTAKRFEVTENSYQRRIVAKKDDEMLADVYFGTSPAYRLLHARLASGGPVYGIEFAHYEAASDAKGWLDKQLLRPSGAIESIERIGEYTLSKTEDEGWNVDVAGSLDNDKVQKFVDRFENLSVYGMNTDDLPAQYQARFVLKDGKGTVSLTIYDAAEGDEKDYVVVSDRISGQYEIPSYMSEEILADIGTLMAEEAENGDGSGNDSAQNESKVVDDVGTVDSMESNNGTGS